MPTPMPDSVTYGEMCQFIANYCNKQGMNITANQIWNYSPSGELWAIPGWFEAAWRNTENPSLDGLDKNLPMVDMETLR